MLKTTTLALSALAATVAVPAAAQAQSYGYPAYGYQQPYYGQRAYDGRYAQNHAQRCKSGTTGMIVGGAAGALAGRAIERNRNAYRYQKRGGTTGAIIGGALGALVGRQATRTC